MINYSRDVYYYETDKMGIVHHSNYIRIMEEARMHALGIMGHNFKSIEDTGLVSPVVSVECRYVHPLQFGDTFEVHVFTGKCSPATFNLEYDIYCGDTLCAKGKTSHCFTGENGRPVNMKKVMPEFLEDLMKYARD